MAWVEVGVRHAPRLQRVPEWTQAHGTLALTLVPDTGNPSVTNVNVSVTF